MIDGLAIIHQSPKSNLNEGWLEALRPQGSAADWFSWETCLRRLALNYVADGQRLTISPSFRTYSGVVAYRFLLEILSGLHSPVVGETEVLGQFKSTVRKWKFTRHPFGGKLEHIVSWVFDDVKKVRSKYLTHLGSRSYGSQVRRLLKGIQTHHIIGSGQLVESILPWLEYPGSNVNIYCRSPRSARFRIGNKKDVRILGLEDLKQIIDITSGSLIIAAPLSAQKILNLFEDQGLSRFVCVLDLRGESDSLGCCRKQVIDLKGFFEIENTVCLKTREKMKSAFQYIKELAFRRDMHMEIRPYGWEDFEATSYFGSAK